MVCDKDATADGLNVTVGEYGNVLVEVGNTMADGSPRYSFDFNSRLNGCVEIVCSVTHPADGMHICDLHEFLEAIRVAIAAGEEHGITP